jgi:hypothetical protein
MTPLAFLLASWVLFVFAFTPLQSSTDEWWQLKAGKWIAENGVPQHEFFTYTAEGAPYYDHEWLAQLLLWRVYQAGESTGWGGWRAIVTFKTLVLWMAYVGLAALLARRSVEPVFGALAAVPAIALARGMFWPRPTFLSYLGLALLLWLFMEWRAGRLKDRWLWISPPLLALWANLHGGWPAGLAVLGAFAAEAAWSLLVAWRSGAPLARAWRRAALTAGVAMTSALATLATPYGFQLYGLYEIWIVNDPLMELLHSEFQPVDWFDRPIVAAVVGLCAALALRPRTAKGLAAALAVGVLVSQTHRVSGDPRVLTAIGLVAMGLATWRARLPGGVAHLLLVLFFGWQAFQNKRQLSLLALVLLPVLLWRFEAWWHELRDRWLERSGSLPADTSAGALRAPGRGRLAGIPAVAVLVVLALLSTFQRGDYWSNVEKNLLLLSGTELQPVYFANDASQPRPYASRLPEGEFLIPPYTILAVDFIEAADLPGRIFNGNNYAGYLIWKLAPEKHKVFTDNRYDVYGTRYLLDVENVEEGWDRAFYERAVAHGLVPGWRPFSTWQEILDRWGIQTLLLRADAPIQARLPENGWLRVWEDFRYTVWVRDTPETPGDRDTAAQSTLGGFVAIRSGHLAPASAEQPDQRRQQQDQLVAHATAARWWCLVDRLEGLDVAVHLDRDRRRREQAPPVRPPAEEGAAVDLRRRRERCLGVLGVGALERPEAAAVELIVEGTRRDPDVVRIGPHLQHVGRRSPPAPGPARPYGT